MSMAGSAASIIIPLGEEPVLQPTIVRGRLVAARDLEDTCLPLPVPMKLLCVLGVPGVLARKHMVDV